MLAIGYLLLSAIKISGDIIVNQVGFLYQQSHKGCAMPVALSRLTDGWSGRRSGRGSRWLRSSGRPTRWSFRRQKWKKSRVTIDQSFETPKVREDTTKTSSAPCAAVSYCLPLACSASTSVVVSKSEDAHRANHENLRRVTASFLLDPKPPKPLLSPVSIEICAAYLLHSVDSRGYGGSLGTSASLVYSMLTIARILVKLVGGIRPLLSGPRLTVASRQPPFPCQTSSGCLYR